MGIKAHVTLIDDYGRTSSKLVETTATTLADAKTAISGWAAAFADVSDLGILAVQYTDVDDSEAYAQTAGANVDVGATFQVVVGDGGKASHKIPGIKATFVGGQGTIDVTDPTIAAYFALYETGGSLRLSDSEYVQTLVKGQLDR